MNHKIYLATSWKNEEYILILAKILRDNGFEVYCFAEKGQGQRAFAWAEITGSDDDGITCLRNHKSVNAFNSDKSALDWCDTCILVLPSGKDSHLEAGYVKGRGCRLFILGQFPRGDFTLTYLLADGLFRVENLNKLIEALKE